jgi:hypothetical protein
MGSDYSLPELTDSNQGDASAHDTARRRLGICYDRRPPPKEVAVTAVPRRSLRPRVLAASVALLLTVACGANQNPALEGPPPGTSSPTSSPTESPTP